MSENKAEISFSAQSLSGPWNNYCSIVTSAEFGGLGESFSSCAEDGLSGGKEGKGSWGIEDEADEAAYLLQRKDRAERQEEIEVAYDKISFLVSIGGWT